ncbi:MAG: MotA/TolQ/ExbB proton channel family protein [Sedimentisphaerales bacterium]|nr:MotA/TolQ/ExbB proton channel family protein [Sedimentisphaerales bacterium]
MDLATLIGLFLGISLVGYAIFAGAGDKVGVFIDPGSAMMVIGGSIASTLVSFPLAAFLRSGKIFSKALMHKEQSAQKLIADLVGYAEIARRDGILSLENATRDANDPFIVKGIQMAVDGTDPELIEQIMNNELEAIAGRHDQGKAIFDNFGKYGPAFGMIGTLVGLVVMLMNMDDPSKIGPGMAMALLTTLYGSMFANMFALPVADKLSQRSDEELMLKTIIIKGVMSIQSGDNPRIVEQKLKTFLPPSMRGEEDKDQEE